MANTKNKKKTVISKNNVKKATSYIKSEKKSLVPHKPKNLDTILNKENEHLTITSPYRVTLRLNTITNTRISIAHMIRLVASGKLSHEEGRSYCYLLQTQIAGFRADAELSIIKRFDDMEKKINALINEGKI